MYKIVIFDLDGTLLDTIGDLGAAGNRTCKKFGWREHDLSEYPSMVGHGTRNFIKNLKGDLKPGENPEPETEREALAYFRASYAACYLDTTKPYKNMPEILKKLKSAGVLMGVCSNKDDIFTRELIEKFYPGIFGAVRGGRPETPVKPDPAGALEVLKILKNLKDLKSAKAGTGEKIKILFVGDSVTDINTGRAAGFDVCSVTWGYRPEESLRAAAPDFIAHTPQEAAEIILHADG